MAETDFTSNLLVTLRKPLTYFLEKFKRCKAKIQCIPSRNSLVGTFLGHPIFQAHGQRKINILYTGHKPSIRV